MKPPFYLYGLCGSYSVPRQQICVDIIELWCTFLREGKRAHGFMRFHIHYEKELTLIVFVLLNNVLLIKDNKLMFK